MSKVILKNIGSLLVLAALIVLAVGSEDGGSGSKPDDELRFKSLKAIRGNYNIEYTPPKSATPFATLQLNFPKETKKEIIALAMEAEARVWLKRYPVPIMVSSFDNTGALIDLTSVRRSYNFLVGWIKEGETAPTLCWKVVSSEELPKYDNKKLLEIYKDVPKYLSDSELLERQAEVIQYSKARVLGFLRYPLDAEFDFWDVPEMRWNEDQDVFFVTSTVKAKNAFGAQLTYRWATIVMLDNNEWNLVSCVIDNEYLYESSKLVAKIKKRNQSSPIQIPIPEPPIEKDKNIMDVIAERESMSIFYRLINEAGLADIIRGDGPYTVFIPLDIAFNKMDKSALEELQKPENKEKLIALLKNHIIEGEMMTSDIANAGTLKTIGGGELKISKSDRFLILDEASEIGRSRVWESAPQGDSFLIINETSRILGSNITCKNGAILITECVLIPSSE